MNQASSKSSLFKKYVGSYLLVFFIPFALFLAFVNTGYIQNLRQELIATQQNVLQQTNLLLDDQIMEMNTIGNKINQSRLFTSPSLSYVQNPASYVEILKLYQSSSRSIKDIFIIVDSNSTVYSSRGTMSMSAMLDKTSHFKIADKEALLDTLASTEENLSVHTMDRITVENEAAAKMVYYTMPLNGAENKRGNIVFVMDTQVLKGSLETVGEKTGTSFVIDSSGKIVFSTGKSSLLSQIDYKQLFADIQGNDSVEIDQMTYFPMVKENASSGWTFVTLTENDLFYQPLNQVLWLIGMLIVALIIVGMGISFYFSVRYYRPIKNLAATFDNDDGLITDEFSFINSSISQTHSELKLLNSLVNEHAPIVRNASLINLIEGRHAGDDVEHIMARLQEVDLNFNYPLFTVVVIEIGEKSIEATSLLNVETMVQNLNKIVSKDQKFSIEATVPYLQNNKIIAIVNMDRNQSETMNQSITRIQDTLLEMDTLEKRSFKIGIGTTYDTIGKINNSYIEASSALEMINIDSKKTPDLFKVLYFKQINVQKTVQKPIENFQYPLEDTMLLQQSIKQGNQRAATETIDHFFDALHPLSYATILRQAVIADMLNSVLKISNELGFSNDYPSFYRLSDFSDLEETKKVLSDVATTVIDQVIELQEYQSNDIVKQVVQYVYANYDSPDISLEEIASNYNISISYASKLVKDETGESFSNILQSLRMKKFIELLLTTDEAIKNLVIKVGYYDVSNFTRKFRKENGITPGEYRKKFSSSRVKIS